MAKKISPKTKSKEKWEKDLRKLIENWFYQAGDDISASALADEVIEKVGRHIAQAQLEVMSQTPTFLQSERQKVKQEIEKWLRDNVSDGDYAVRMFRKSFKKSKITNPKTKV